MKSLVLLIVGISFTFSGACQNWQALGGGLSDNVSEMCSDTVTDNLYVSGYFSLADGSPVNRIARWDGSNWYPMDQGSPCSPVKFCMHRDTLFATGCFPDTSTQFVYWNGTNWIEIYDFGWIGIGGMKSHNNELFIYGTFDTIAGVATNSIIKWDGITWIDLNFPYYNTPSLPVIMDMQIYNGEIYVAGRFDDTLYNEVNVARFDGTAWYTAGYGCGGQGTEVFDLEVYNGELYAAGRFPYPAPGIAKWNGNSWTDVGGSLHWNTNWDIRKMAVYDSKLYAVGLFDTIGGIGTGGIAAWDGTNWCKISEPSYFSTAHVFNNELYVGTEQYIGTTPVNYIAKWIGGNYVDTCGNTTGIEEHTQDAVSVYPNPFSTSTTFELTGNLHFPLELVLFNSIGQQVKREAILGNYFELYKDNLSEGIYFYSIQEQGGRAVARGKLVMQ